MLSFSGLRQTALLAAVSGFGFLAPASAAQAVSLDVPYVPTPDVVVHRMLEVAQVGPQDFVIDLGSGDGRIAISAVKDHGAKGALGVDLNPERIAEAQANARDSGVSDKVEFREQNLFHTDFSAASVLTMYLLPDVNVALRDKVLALAPGTRVVSHAFDMAEWESDHYERVDGRAVYMWVVPADVQGRWRLTSPDGTVELDLSQQFQHVTGTAQGAQGEMMPVTGRLKGPAIELTLGEGETAQRLAGNVQGASMLASPADANGTVSGQNWQGERL